MMNRHVFGLGMALLALTVWAGVAQAGIITVPNGDFEDYTGISGWSSLGTALPGALTDGNDEFWSNPSDFGSGWTNNGTQPSNGKYGLQHPKDSQHTWSGSSLASPANGHFIGFINMDEDDATGAHTGQIESDVLGVLQTGSYTLNVAVGARPVGSWTDIEYTISLVAGGNVVGSASTTLSPSTATLGSGEWEDLQLIVSTAGSAHLGEDLTVRIDTANQGALGDFTQANFDNVRLSYIPEPSSLVLLGLAGLGMVCFRRRGGA